VIRHGLHDVKLVDISAWIDTRQKSRFRSIKKFAPLRLGCTVPRSGKSAGAARHFRRRTFRERLSLIGSPPNSVEVVRPNSGMAGRGRFRARERFSGVRCDTRL
jgi:hypothetical protein